MPAAMSSTMLKVMPRNGASTNATRSYLAAMIRNYRRPPVVTQSSLRKRRELFLNRARVEMTKRLPDVGVTKRTGKSRQKLKNQRIISKLVSNNPHLLEEIKRNASPRARRNGPQNNEALAQESLEARPADSSDREAFAQKNPVTVTDHSQSIQAAYPSVTSLLTGIDAGHHLSAPLNSALTTEMTTENSQSRSRSHKAGFKRKRDSGEPTEAGKCPNSKRQKILTQENESHAAADSSLSPAHTSLPGSPNASQGQTLTQATHSEASLHKAPQEHLDETEPSKSEPSSSTASIASSRHIEPTSSPTTSSPMASFPNPSDPIHSTASSDEPIPWQRKALKGTMHYVMPPRDLGPPAPEDYRMIKRYPGEWLSRLRYAAECDRKIGAMDTEFDIPVQHAREEYESIQAHVELYCQDLFDHVAPSKLPKLSNDFIDHLITTVPGAIEMITGAKSEVAREVLKDCFSQGTQRYDLARALLNALWFEEVWNADICSVLGIPQWSPDSPFHELMADVRTQGEREESLVRFWWRSLQRKKFLEPHVLSDTLALCDKIFSKFEAAMELCLEDLGRYRKRARDALFDATKQVITLKCRMELAGRDWEFVWAARINGALEVPIMKPTLDVSTRYLAPHEPKVRLPMSPAVYMSEPPNKNQQGLLAWERKQLVETLSASEAEKYRFRDRNLMFPARVQLYNKEHLDQLAASN